MRIVSSNNQPSFLMVFLQKMQFNFIPLKYFVFLTLLILLFVFGESKKDPCPFEQTVNLTNHKPLDNGYYLYQGIAIPPEKTRRYDYEVKFLGVKKSVSPHMRGCVCDKKPCIKLCCGVDEFLNETKTSNQCEKLRKDMKVSWNLTLRPSNGSVNTIKNMFGHFAYQVGFPCDQPKAMVKEDKAILFENGTLYARTDNSFLTTQDYCYSPRFDNESDYILLPFSCPINTEVTWQLLLNTYAMAISVFFFIPTIVVYSSFRELRGNLSGKLLICYLSSLTIGYGIITFINISQLRFEFMACSLLGFSCYFFFMAAFFWLGVMCFDIWINFTETSVERDSRKKFKYFLTYSLLVWLSAGVATGLLIFIEASPSIDEVYKPGIGTKMCWLNTEKWSALIYFYGPELLILLFNCVTFCHLTIRVYNIKRELARVTQTERLFAKNVVVILRLFLVMGISWVFDIVSYCVREYKKWEFLFFFSDFANAIQGISIFSLFVLKSNVLDLLKNRFHKKQSKSLNKSISCCSTSFSKLQTSTSVQPVETAC